MLECFEHIECFPDFADILTCDQTVFANWCPANFANWCPANLQRRLWGRVLAALLITFQRDGSQLLQKNTHLGGKTDKRLLKVIYPYLKGAEKELPAVSFPKEIIKKKGVSAWS